MPNTFEIRDSGLHFEMAHAVGDGRMAELAEVGRRTIEAALALHLTEPMSSVLLTGNTSEYDIDFEMASGANFHYDILLVPAPARFKSTTSDWVLISATPQRTHLRDQILDLAQRFVASSIEITWT